MNSFQSASDHALLMFFIYKALILLTGLAIVYMGYKLFLKGFLDNSSSFEGQHGKSKIKMQRIAPGIFFALFGASIIGVSVYKKFTLDNGITNKDHLSLEGREDPDNRPNNDFDIKIDSDSNKNNKKTIDEAVK